MKINSYCLYVGEKGKMNKKKILSIFFYIFWYFLYIVFFLILSVHIHFFAFSQMYVITQTLHHEQELTQTGLNLEFSFSKTGCHTKVKNPNLFNYLPIEGE